MKSITKYLVAANLALAIVPAYAAGEAKNVIFFLGDGMGPTTVTAARIYKYGEAGALNMESLRRTARIKTFSNDAQTTDSAPSMAAYMTGVKMNNEVLSMSSNTSAYNMAVTPPTPYVSGSDTTCPAGNGTPVTTLLELAKAAGKSVGAVTTTRITHATPAATYAHICHRDGENRIAEQLTPGHANYNAALGTGLDVILGGGLRHFKPTTTTVTLSGVSSAGKRTDGADLITLFTAGGYNYVDTGAAFALVDPAVTTKLIGLFNMDHLNYELDRAKPASGKDEPSLADMTEKAVRILSKNTSKGYFLMVEGGRIDHALHGTNAKRALEDTIAFDDAIARAISLADANTLIVVTADHDHTMTINGYSHKGNPILGLSSDFVKTKVAQTANPAAAPVNAKAADALPYTTLVFGNGGNTRQPGTRADLTLVDTAADNYNQDVGVQTKGGVGSETHGGGDVMLFSKGPGNAGFKGTMENVKVFGLVKTALGL
jgi:alkaline phosphatase